MEGANHIGEDETGIMSQSLLCSDETAATSSDQSLPVNFESQLTLLKIERDINLCHWMHLKKLSTDKSGKLSFSGLNLIPAIKHQRKANCSLEATLKKMLKGKPLMDSSTLTNEPETPASRRPRLTLSNVSQPVITNGTEETENNIE